MGAYKHLRTTLAERQLIMTVLVDGNTTTRAKVVRAHQSWESRTKVVSDYERLRADLGALKQQNAADPKYCEGIDCCLVLLRAGSKDANQRATAGSVMLNLTGDDQKNIRAALKQHAKEYPDDAEACKALYKRVGEPVVKLDT